MSETPRRLSAVVFTDIAGYTALAQRDESLALRVLEEHNALVRSVLRQHHGREIKTIGDAFLLEFESAYDAVLCAVDIQSMLWQHNRSSEESKRIQIRIGIHVGDVVHLGGDILGDTVNIASRIVRLAEPGRICVSEQAYYQIRNKVNYSLLRIPNQKLKGVELEAELYQVILPWEDGGNKKKSEVKSLSAMKNRIAVIPFENISPDSNDGYLADGLTEELISVLSEIQGLRVIAKSSVSQFRGSNKSVAEMGNELQVPFIVEGSVRKVGNKIRVAAQLIDVGSQENVWSSRYDRNLDDVFLIQSDIAKQVAEQLQVKLLAAEKERIQKWDTENLIAYAAYLKGRALLHQRTEQAIKGAKEQFDLAIKEDPTFARAYAGLADTHFLLGEYLFAPIPDSIQETKWYISKALELDPDMAEAHVSLANSLMYDYKFHEAEAEFRKAISLNPSYATAHHWYATCLEQLGHGEDALAELLLAEQLDPLSTTIIVSIIYAHIDIGKFDEATKRLKRLIEIDPDTQILDETKMVIHFAKKEWKEALYYLERLKSRDPNDPYLDSDLAFIYAATGRREESLKVIEKLKEVPESSGLRSTLLAFAYAGLNDLDECFRCLEDAIASREVFFGWFRQYPLLENVRKDPRFDVILRRVGLVSAKSVALESGQ